jgi:hypothetical protein
VNHDHTLPLTVPVPAGEALLLDHLGHLSLPEAERREMRDNVAGYVNGLLEVLPCGTPTPLVDALCGLLHDLDGLLGLSVATPDISCT